MRIRALDVAAVIVCVAAIAIIAGGQQTDEPISTAHISVIDGDTFRIGAERVRILNIDAPEMGDRAECAYERQHAVAAKARLAELLLSGTVTIERAGTDRFGRTLAQVEVDGRDVGELLVMDKVAVPWAGFLHDWC